MGSGLVVALPKQLVATARRPATEMDVRDSGFVSTELFMASHSPWGDFSEMGILFGDAADGGASTSGWISQTSFSRFSLEVHSSLECRKSSELPDCCNRGNHHHLLHYGPRRSHYRRRHQLRILCFVSPTSLKTSRLWHPTV